MKKISLKKLLEAEYHYYNQNESFALADPLVVLREHKDEEAFSEIALICALFAYGNANQIVKFLYQLDFSLLKSDQEKILQSHFPYYRFQSQDDVKQIFSIMAKILQEGGIKKSALQGYRKGNDFPKIIHLINACIQRIYFYMTDYNSFGVSHFFQKPVQNIDQHSALKRYNLFLRWMVRQDRIDFGVWKEINTRDLILPLDTHTFRVCQGLKLIESKVANLKTALLVTEKLKKFDPNDPVKYDFSLYRIGQSQRKIIK